MGGKSSAKTLSTLTRFNGIVSWLVYEMFEMEPKFIGSTSARKHAGIKVPRGQKAKQVVLQYLLDNEPAFKKNTLSMEIRNLNRMIVRTQLL